MPASCHFAVFLVFMPTTSPAADAYHDEQVMAVLALFRGIYSAVRTHFGQVEKTVGLGGAQVWALAVVQAQPGLRINELARAMHIRQPTASNLVKALAAQGLLTMQRSESDRRVVQLNCTESGNLLLARVPGPLMGILPAGLQRLTPEALLRLHTELQNLVQVLQVDAAAAYTPLSEC